MAIDTTFLQLLQHRFRAQLSIAGPVREVHGRDESCFHGMLPDAVVFAESTQDVVDLLQLCASHRVPVIPFGAGTSIEGHVLPVQGGVSLDLSRMNAVLNVRPDDLCATVQAGVTRLQLNAHLKDAGLFFPIDPGADATLGGMTATRASGTNAVRYGTMRDNVMALTVVMADGSVVRTGTLARKSSAGYDLTRMFVGSEGTLGVITEVTVRLYPQPESVAAAVCSFPEADDAIQTVMATIQQGIPVARAEFLDAVTVAAINRHSQLSLPEQPMLFLEFHGTQASVREQAQSVQALAHDRGGRDFEWSVHAEDRTRLWTARHKAFFACLQLRPGSKAFTTDACVPISRLSDCIRETILDTQSSHLPCPIFGHVGDGNFHCVIVTDPGCPEDLVEAERLNQRIMKRAIAMGGTCSGEHGVGAHKIDILAQECGEPALALMRALKQAWDPFGILNPGKVVQID